MEPAWLIALLFGASVWLTDCAQEKREKTTKRMPKRAAQVFSVILCAQFFYVVATIEELFACKSWLGCNSRGAFWTSLDKMLGAIPMTPDLAFWIILLAQGIFFPVMARIENHVQKPYFYSKRTDMGDF